LTELHNAPRYNIWGSRAAASPLGKKGPNLIGTPMVKATLLSVVTADETLIRVLTGVFTPPDSVHIKPRLDVAGAAAMGVARRNGQPTASPVRCHQQSSII
jgi:hypothetical protein